MWWLVITVFCSLNGIYTIPLPDEKTCRKVEASFVEFAKLEALYGYGTTCWNEQSKDDEIKALCDPYYP